ncbi:hypothetical protein SBBP1_50053 [Burkholderiales bacterium]|nr:hypothetical protein SBBP1_50053 [Burkholderiales bacterium]
MHGSQCLTEPPAFPIGGKLDAGTIDPAKATVTRAPAGRHHMLFWGLAAACARVFSAEGGKGNV